MIANDLPRDSRATSPDAADAASADVPARRPAPPAVGDVVVRQTTPADYDGIIDICRRVYPAASPWKKEQLATHGRLFPEGQFVAVDQESGRVAGMAASLVIKWSDYDLGMSYKDFTDAGWFTNHDLENGRTLYGAEVMVDPATQGRGVGGKLYAARRDLVKRLDLLRIRAGARLRGYHRYASEMTPREYAARVALGDLSDPTLSFQMKHGFVPIAVQESYLPNDPESLGHAIVIEWLNEDIATEDDLEKQRRRFERFSQMLRDELAEK